MNYIKAYNQIIDRAKTRNLEGYKETHHIIPRFAGGTDGPENLVNLTAREHFICHWLLTKIYPSGQFHYKAIHAFACMAWLHSENQERYKCSSKVYELVKEKYSRLRQFLMNGRSNPCLGTIWISNENLRVSKKIKRGNQIPDGWIKGRNTWLKSEFESKRLLRVSERKRLHEQEKQSKKKIKEEARLLKYEKEKAQRLLKLEEESRIYKTLKEERKLESIRLLKEGKSLREISKILGISHMTVFNYTKGD